MVQHVEIDYVPAGPTIARFHLSDSFFRVLIGPLGSAKTTACCMEVWRRIISQAADAKNTRRSRWLMVRSTYPRAYGEPKTDMALFLMDGVDVPVVPLAGASEHLVYGAKLAIVGYPLGVSKIVYEGIVAGRFARPGNDMDDYILMQIFGAPGSSGSSVVDVETGEVVGVLVAARQAMTGLPVIFATPIDYREYLLEVHAHARNVGPAGVESGDD